MNREIKFRVWEKGSSNLLGYEYFNTVLNNGFFYTCMSELKEGETEEDLICHSEFHNPPMLKPKKINQLLREQFIGLKDKNGGYIYEGDICRILYTDWPSNTDPNIPLDEYLDSISYIGYISYDAPTYCIMIKDRYGEYSHNKLNVGQHGRITVIGNIHQNPDLL